MRKLNFLLFATFIMLFTSLHCLGQDCIQLTTQTMTCGGPNNCQQTVAVNLPQAAQYGYTQGAPVDVACCSSYIQSYTTGSGCEGSDLKNPEIKRALAEEAKSQPIMIASCRGQYSLYRDETPAPKLAMNKNSPTDLKLNDLK